MNISHYQIGSSEVEFAFFFFLTYTYTIFCLAGRSMQKVFIPRNISGGWFNMSVQLGPFSISILQLMTLAVGMGLGLGVWNVLYKNGVSRYVAIVVALPIFLIFVFIAFFKYSELTLFPFIAKMIRTYFLDVTKKFQINWLRPDIHAINLARFRTTDHEVVIEQKALQMNEKELRKLESLTRKHKYERK